MFYITLNTISAFKGLGWTEPVGSALLLVIVLDLMSKGLCKRLCLGDAKDVKYTHWVYCGSNVYMECHVHYHESPWNAMPCVYYEFTFYMDAIM